jgi:hypothetical protein
MKNKWDIIVLVAGIICFLISIVKLFPISALVGVVMIIFGLIGIPHFKGEQASINYNYRIVNSSFNCMNCKYCHMEYFDGTSADCKFFEIKIDEKHVCDKFILSFERLVN